MPAASYFRQILLHMLGMCAIGTGAVAICITRDWRALLLVFGVLFALAIIALSLEYKRMRDSVYPSEDLLTEIQTWYEGPKGFPLNARFSVGACSYELSKVLDPAIVAKWHRTKVLEQAIIPLFEDAGGGALICVRDADENSRGQIEIWSKQGDRYAMQLVASKSLVEFQDMLEYPGNPVSLDDLILELTRQRRIKAHTLAINWCLLFTIIGSILANTSRADERSLQAVLTLACTMLPTMIGLCMFPGAGMRGRLTFLLVLAVAGTTFVQVTRHSW